ncbi:MAG TPA: hypothetical protein VLA19_24030 [Herpetosiphonaceae bacterium]|nr:hypothetical protein [Herpetosiphonaceae bacterium]
MARTTPSASRERGRSVLKTGTRWTVPLILGLLTALAFGAWLAFGRGGAGSSNAGDGHTAGGGHAGDAVQIPHLHGLGFSADGRELFVPAHTGLRIYADGRWRNPDLPVNDYMGYSPTDDGFYSSGHPGPGSDLVNPLGLVKSSDGGKTLTTLGFAGESDFHLMAVGYRNHAIYVFNPSPNSKLGIGLYYSVDDGKTWQQSALKGVNTQPTQIAVHPTEASTVALATDEGVLLSSDHGASFEQIGPAAPVTAVAWSPDGKQFVFGATKLSAYDVESKQVKELSTPSIEGQDAIAYIAVNPQRRDELAFATYARDIYLSSNAGQTWTQIAQDGAGTSAR